eukprot:SAG11_NODE_720_length_7550_cov_12.284257_3_plen_104_part_00
MQGWRGGGLGNFRTEFGVGTIPKAQLEEYKVTFELFDKNGDGKITAEELVGVFKFLGQTPDMEEVRVRLTESIPRRFQIVPSPSHVSGVARLRREPMSTSSSS